MGFFGFTQGNQASAYTTSIVATAAAPSTGARTSYALVTNNGLSFPSDGFAFAIHNTSAAPGAVVMDIAVGSSADSANLTVLVSDFLVNSLRTLDIDVGAYFPIHLPVSSFIHIRSASSSIPTVVAGFIFYKSTTHQAEPGNQVYTFGVSTTRGVVIDPGGSLGVMGSWFSMGTTSAHIRWLSINMGNNANTAMATNTWTLDIGIGESGSQTILMDKCIHTTCTTASDQLTITNIGPLPVSIPSNTILWLRARSELVTNATDRLLQCALYGVG